jgi:uncharacterized membrane protein YbhN (UPF0104 family)
MELAEQVLLGLRTFHSPTRLAGFGFWTAAIWSMDCVSVLLGTHALGIELPFRVAMLLIAGMGLGSALPSTPGYVGIYQFVTVSVLTPFGVPHDDALAYSLFASHVVVLALVWGVFTLGWPGDAATARLRPKHIPTHRTVTVRRPRIVLRKYRGYRAAM